MMEISQPTVKCVETNEDTHLHYYRNPINHSDRISYTTKFEDACCWC